MLIFFNYQEFLFSVLVIYSYVYQTWSVCFYYMFFYVNEMKLEADSQTCIFFKVIFFTYYFLDFQVFQIVLYL